MRPQTFVLLFLFIALAFLCYLCIASENYYDILGIAKGASENDIKRAYKKLALKWHPDKHKGKEKEKAQQMFQKVSHAYEVLKDADKRKLYDQFGEEGLKQQGHRGNSDPFDLFNSFGFNFGGAGRGQRNPQQEERKGPSFTIDLDATLEDLYNGRTLTVTHKKQILCPVCRGTGAQNPDDVQTCPVCSGSGVRVVTQQLGPGFITQTQTTCNKCGGKGKIVKGTCSACKGHKVSTGEDTITVFIQPGTLDNAELVFEGEGQEQPDTLAGDLIFKVRTVDHQRFKRSPTNPSDLHYNMTISLLQALVGFEKTIKHLDGHQVSIQRNEVTKPGLVMTIAGEGMPTTNDPSVHGDLHVHFTVKFPTAVTEEQKEGFRKLLTKEKKEQQDNNNSSSKE